MKTELVYEDGSVLVIYKPAGFPVQSARPGEPDVVSELKNYLHGKARREGNSAGAGSPYLGVIHRLDQPVEGLLVFAGKKTAAARLSQEISRGTLNKRYYAVVSGIPAETAAGLCDSIVKDERTRAARIVTGQEASFSEAKRALLEYRVIGKISEPEPFSMLEVRIETGRFHQIRAQLAHAGLPILGDQKYGNEKSISLSRTLGVRNVALCAYELSFPHPEDSRPMEFTVSPKGEIFSRFV